MSTRMEMVVGAGRQLQGGRYVIEHPIGTPGGEGAVYRAQDHLFRRYVAVKVIHPGLYGMFRDAFDAQIAFLATVDNPWCIEVYDHFTIPASNGWQETAALVMRLADRSLADVIRPGGVGRAMAIEATLHATRGLDELHRRGGTHNDVKPHNLLQVSGDGPPRWVLSDFGVAKLLDGTHAYQQSMDMRYAPPERIRWGQVRRPGDVFSLGMTFHEAMCGELPGGYGDYVVSPFLDRRAAELVTACLAPDPADRPSLDAVQHSLHEMGADVVDPPPATGGRADVPPRRAHTLRPMAAPLPPTTQVRVDRTLIYPEVARSRLAPPPPPPPPAPRPRSAPARAAKPARARRSVRPLEPQRPRRRRRPIRAVFRATFLVLLVLVGSTVASGAIPELAGGGLDRAVDRFVDGLLDRADDAVRGIDGTVEAPAPPG